MMNITGITEEEEPTLKQFRERLGPFLDEFSEEQKKDYNLIRWLRARDYDLVKAEDMLRKHMGWRKANNLDKILERRPSVDFMKLVPFQVPGKDKDGCYIFIFCGGKWDLRSLCEQGLTESLQKYSLRFYELIAEFIRKSAEEKGEPVTQIMIIQDMEGFAMSQFLCSDVRDSQIKSTKIMEANYPEMLKKSIVVNAPTFFSTMFAIMKPLLSARTLEKLEIYNSNRENWRSSILQYVNPDDLPSYYGGSNTSCPNYHTDEVGIGLYPRGTLYSEDLYKTFTVAAGQQYPVHVHISKPGTVLTWNFKTDTYDIGFHFLRETERIFENNRCDSHLVTQKGIYTCKVTGKYTLLFDNSYSKIRSKVVHYYVHEDC